jgi:hypothetical protein
LRSGIFSIRTSQLEEAKSIPMTCHLLMMLIQYRILPHLREQAGFGVTCTSLEDLEQLIKVETSEIADLQLLYINIEF